MHADTDGLASVWTERVPGQSSCGRAAITAPSYAGSQLICNEAIIRGVTREKRSPASIYSLGHGPATSGRWLPPAETVSAIDDLEGVNIVMTIGNGSRISVETYQ